MKKINIRISVYIITAIVMLGVIIGLRFINQTKSTETVIKSIPVRVQEMVLTEYDETLYYIGAVSVDSVQSLSFKSPGKIEKIHVDINDRVATDTLLMTLDTQDLEFELQGAKSQMDAAYAGYQVAINGASSEEIEQARLTMEKAKEVYEFTQKTLDEYTILLEEEIVSSKEYDQVALETHLALNDYNTAVQVYNQVVKGAEQETIDLYYSQYEQAKVNYEHKLSLLEGAELYSTIEGTVVQLPYEENTLIAAGYPVISIKKDQEIITIGVTDEDYNQIQLGNSVKVSSDDKETLGTITNKADLPDITNHLYEVEITLDHSDVFIVGEIVGCDIVVGKKAAMIVPIDSVIVNGETFVYVASGNKAEKRIVEIVDILDNQIIMNGLWEGDQLIVDNIKKINNGKSITIIQD